MDKKPLRKVGIIANPGKRGARSLLERLAREFGLKGVDVFVAPEARGLLGEDEGRGIADIEVGEMCDVVDMVVVLGGDGTMLRAVRELGVKPIPMVGVNIGSLGFLTAATEEAAEVFVADLVDGRYAIEERSLVQAELIRGGRSEVVMTGLNEVVVSRGAISRIINLEAWIDGKFLNRFHADGLIVATPTGSTAYSLSAGGPIISPGASVLTITPVCPHALANRSFVVEDTAEIKIYRESEAEEVVLAVDGQQMESVGDGDTVVVRRGEFSLPLVHLDGQGIFGVLQRKLGWHGSHV